MQKKKEKNLKKTWPSWKMHKEIQKENRRKTWPSLNDKDQWNWSNKDSGRNHSNTKSLQVKKTVKGPRTRTTKIKFAGSRRQNKQGYYYARQKRLQVTYRSLKKCNEIPENNPKLLERELEGIKGDTEEVREVLKTICWAFHNALTNGKKI